MQALLSVALAVARWKAFSHTPKGEEGDHAAAVQAFSLAQQVLWSQYPDTLVRAEGLQHALMASGVAVATGPTGPGDTITVANYGEKWDTADARTTNTQFKLADAKFQGYLTLSRGTDGEPWKSEELELVEKLVLPQEELDRLGVSPYTFAVHQLDEASGSKQRSLEQQLLELRREMETLRRTTALAQSAPPPQQLVTAPALAPNEAKFLAWNPASDDVKVICAWWQDKDRRQSWVQCMQDTRGKHWKFHASSKSFRHWARDLECLTRAFIRSWKLEGLDVSLVQEQGLLPARIYMESIEDKFKPLQHRAGGPAQLLTAMEARHPCWSPQRWLEYARSLTFAEKAEDFRRWKDRVWFCLACSQIFCTAEIMCEIMEKRGISAKWKIGSRHKTTT